MSAVVLNTIANIIITVAFSTALVAVIVMPVHPGSFMRHGIKVLVGGAMFIYVFVGASHVLQFTGVTNSLDIYENFLKVLFIPLLASAAYALRVNEQLRITERQARVLSAEHDMLMRVVDTTPTGVAVLDTDGRIEFANEKAKHLLQLEEDRDTGAIRTPSWTFGSDPDSGPGVMRSCAGTEARRDVMCTFSWPNGTMLHVTLNSTPIYAADGTVVGAVVAFSSTEAASASA